MAAGRWSAGCDGDESSSRGQFFWSNFFATKAAQRTDTSMHSNIRQVWRGGEQGWDIPIIDSFCFLFLLFVFVFPFSFPFSDPRSASSRRCVSPCCTRVHRTELEGRGGAGREVSARVDERRTRRAQAKQSHQSNEIRSGPTDEGFAHRGCCTVLMQIADHCRPINTTPQLPALSPVRHSPPTHDPSTHRVSHISSGAAASQRRP